MTDLPKRIEAHLIQCHHDDDDSERLLAAGKRARSYAEKHMRES